MQPGAALQQGHLTAGIADRRQRRRAAAGQVALAQPRGQAQHRPLVAHHLAQLGPAGPAQAEHRAHGFTNRRQLGRIAHKHQPGAKRVGAAQADLQQGGVHHRGLIDQHQAQVLEGDGGLLGFLAALDIALALEFQPQQAVNGGRKPGGRKASTSQTGTQHTHGFMGGGHHSPAEASGFHLGQKAHREEGFAGAGVATEHKGRAIHRSGKPIGKSRYCDLLVGGEGRG